MCKINNSLKIIVFSSLFVTVNGHAQTDDVELYTLFTTQQERELIDRNRYKLDQPKKEIVEEKVDPALTVEAIPMKKETLTIMLSGFTLTQTGQNVAWLNGKPYENGSKLEDGSKVYISSRLKSQVQIKTPDGQYHTVTTGESAEINYLIPGQG